LSKGSTQHARHASCFDSASAYEVMVGGRKLVGSAQVRLAGALLQHGSLPLTAPTALLGTLLAQPPGDLGAHMIALDEAAGRPVAWDAAAAVLAAGFAEALGIELVPAELCDEEREFAGRLREQKYAAAEWTMGR
jgi:lipoate-protein ligase A